MFIVNFLCPLLVFVSYMRFEGVFWMVFVFLSGHVSPGQLKAMIMLMSLEEDLRWPGSSSHMIGFSWWHATSCHLIPGNISFFLWLRVICPSASDEIFLASKRVFKNHHWGLKDFPSEAEIKTNRRMTRRLHRSRWGRPCKLPPLHPADVPGRPVEPPHSL